MLYPWGTMVAGGLVLMMISVISFACSEQSRIGERIRKFRTQRSDRQLSLYDCLASTFLRLANWISPSGSAGRVAIESDLYRAGHSSALATCCYLLLRAAALVIPGLVAIAVVLTVDVSAGKAFVLAGCTGLVLFSLPKLWLLRAIKQRQRRISNSLTDFLDLFVACVESGTTLQSVFAFIAEELRPIHPDLAEEFLVCDRETALGVPLDSAFTAMAHRNGSDELREFAVFISQSRKIGSALGTAMRELADKLRVEREIRAEEQAQKAAVQVLLPTLLFIFPSIFIVLAAPAVIKIYSTFSS